MAKTSDEKRKESRKLSMRRAREKLKSNTDLLEEAREKDRVRKRLARKKFSEEATERQKRKVRRDVRHRVRKSRQKNKAVANILNHLLSPPPSPSNEHPMVQEEPSTSRRRSGGKKRRSNNEKLRKRIALLESQLSKEKTSKAKYKKQCQRLKNKNKTPDDTPVKNVNGILAGESCSEDVRKELIFGQALQSQIHRYIQSEKSVTAKQKLSKALMGAIIQKHSTRKKLNSMISRRIAKSCSILKMTKEARWKNIVAEFLQRDINSRMCPGKKDCKTRSGVKKQKRLLSDNLKNLHKKFLAEFPEMPIGYSTFCKYKPFWVLSPDYRSRDTCLCPVHANFSFMVKKAHSLNIIRESNTTSIIKEVTCQQTDGKTKRECLERTCTDCNRKEIQILSVPDDMEIKFSQWKTVSVEINSKTKKVVKKCIKQDVVVNSAKDFVSDLIKFLTGTFMPHVANFYHQHNTVADIKNSLGPNDVMIHCDFSENYKCKYGEEVQSVHFGGSRAQISLHTVMVYFLGAKKSYCTLSEDLRHGPAAIIAHLNPVIDYIKREKTQIEHVHVLSDGPTTQYRNKSMFHLAATVLTKKFAAKSLHWHYTEKSHGKGAVDGVGGCLKRTADKLVGQGRDISNLSSLVEGLKENCPGVEIAIIEGEGISEVDAKIPSNLSVFKGTFKVHEFTWTATLPAKIQFRRLSCSSCDAQQVCKHFGIGELNVELPRKLNVSDVYSDVEDDSQTNEQNEEDIAPGDYVLVSYEGHLYPGIVEKVENAASYLVSCLVKCGKTDSFKWPAKSDKLTYTRSEIKKKLEPPVVCICERIRAAETSPLDEV